MLKIAFITQLDLPALCVLLQEFRDTENISHNNTNRAKKMSNVSYSSHYRDLMPIKKVFSLCSILSYFIYVFYILYFYIYIYTHLQDANYRLSILVAVNRDPNVEA